MLKKSYFVSTCAAILCLSGSLMVVAQDAPTAPAGRGGRGGGGGADAAAAGPVQTIDQRTRSLKKMEGYIPMYWDARQARMYLEISKFDSQLMYEEQTAYGAGASGISRGAVSRPYVIHFTRVGPKILMVAENFLWRTSSTDPAAQLALKQSFPDSVLWGFTVAAEDAPDHVLVDATEFFLHDAPGFAERLGTGYRQDASRSTIVPENSKNFPLNTMVETMLTFTNEGGGRAAAPGGGGGRGGLGEVAPDVKSVTVRERQSLIELPPPGFRPREWDPRSGYLLNVAWSDWSTPLGEPKVHHYLTKHRLDKKDPNAAVSEAVKPITYYVDRGAPEPVRTALLEGTRWWSAAFEAAGFKNAFKVEILPEGADPLDIRYNMILWVEEAQRGFSNGANIVDPRTGEIMKGEVTLTAGRERQDFLITDALLSPYKTGSKPDPQQLELVKQRIRHLAAHETGHTLGLGHNHAASAFGMGSSVDDYPFPMIAIDASGKLDLSHAYEPGLGEWDKAAITYGYKQFPPATTPEQEKVALDKMMTDTHKRGLYFITDSGNGSVQPHSTQWDNGPDATVELERLMKVRAIAMKNFSEAAIRPGQPMSTLEDVLVPVYLLHRYQTESAAKSIGGQDYRYAVRGDDQLITKIVAADVQRKALAAVLKTLDPQLLTLPESLLEKFPPRPPDFGRTQESFQGYNGPGFDATAAVRAAADITLDVLFESGRAGRLIEYHERDSANPSLGEVIDATLKATWYAPAQTGLAEGSKIAIDSAVLEHLVALSNSATAAPLAKAVVKGELATLRAWIMQHAKDADASAELKAAYTAALDSVGGGGARGGAGAAAAPAAAGGRGGGGGSPTAIPAGAPI
jgi:hypothetical protein